MRVQATARVKKIDKKEVKSDLFLYTIKCFERTYSPGRRKSQERFPEVAQKDGKEPARADGSYFLWHTIKMFVPRRGVDRLDKLREGDTIDFFGQLTEEAWVTDNGEVRTAFVVEQPDLKYVFAQNRGGETRREDRKGPSQPDSGGGGWGDDGGGWGDDDDAPF